MCDFSVAVNDRHDRDRTDFFRVTVWRGLADNCAKYLSKGRKVAVVGAVSAHTFTAQDGSTRVSLEVDAEEVEFLSGKEDAKETKPQATPKEQYQQVEASDLPDLPF